MGCNSDYLEPTAREYELSRAARLYVYALKTLDQEVPTDVLKASQEMYCRRDFVAQLCELISSLDDATIEKVVYNARDKTARDLADWWEAHQEADALRQGTPLAAQLKQIAAAHINGAQDEEARRQAEYNEEQARLIARIDQFVDEELKAKLILAASSKRSSNVRFYASKNRFELHLDDVFWGNPGMEYGIAHNDYSGVLDIESMGLTGAGVQFTNSKTRPIFEHLWFRLRQFAKLNGFQNLTLSYCHDGVGIKSWSVFFLEL